MLRLSGRTLTPAFLSMFLAINLASALDAPVPSVPPAEPAVGEACSVMLHKIARKTVHAGIVKPGDDLDCCRLPSPNSTLTGIPEIDVEKLSDKDALEIARKFVLHSLTASYGPEDSGWRDYSPALDPLDRFRRVTNYLFSNSGDARIPGRIAKLLAEEVKANFREVRDARQLIAADARPLAEKYVSAAFADYSADVVEMFQNSRGSQEEFFAPLVNRIQGCRLDFKQVLEDSDGVLQAQSDLFVAMQPLRDMPELAANPRYRALQEQIDVAFFRRYVDVLAPRAHDAEVYKTLDALATGVDPSETDHLPPISGELREQFAQIQEHLLAAEAQLRESRRRYALGYRAAAMDLALLNRLGRPRGNRPVESTNVLRLLDRDPRLSSGELYAGLYKAARDVIVAQGYFTDNYLDFSLQDITAENIGQILRSAGSFAGPRVFSVILTDDRMRHEFDLGELAALLQEHAALAQSQRLAKQTKWTDNMVTAAGLSWKWAKSILPGGSKIPDDLVTKALNSQRQVLASHGFQEVVPVNPAALPRNLRDLLVSCQTGRYTEKDLSVSSVTAFLQTTLGPLPGYETPPPPEKLSLAEYLVTGIVRDNDAAPVPQNAPAAVATADAAAQTLAPISTAQAPLPSAVDPTVEGTIALQHTLGILSRRADVILHFDLELSIRELVYRKEYAQDTKKLEAELQKLNQLHRIWEKEHQDLLDRVEEATQATIDAFRQAGIDKSVALATLADALPTGLRHFVINVGGRVREKLVPLYARVLIQVINDLNPLQILNDDQLKNVATAAATLSDVQKGISQQKKVGYLAGGVAIFLSGIASYHYVPIVHHAIVEHLPGHSRPAPVTPKPVAQVSVPAPATPAAKSVPTPTTPPATK